MTCVYCGADKDQLKVTDFRIPYEGDKLKSKREYFCLRCQRYFWWENGVGIIKDKEKEEDESFET